MSTGVHQEAPRVSSSPILNNLIHQSRERVNSLRSPKQPCLGKGEGSMEIDRKMLPEQRVESETGFKMRYSNVVQRNSRSLCDEPAEGRSVFPKMHNSESELKTCFYQGHDNFKLLNADEASGVQTNLMEGSYKNLQMSRQNIETSVGSKHAVQQSRSSRTFDMSHSETRNERTNGNHKDGINAIHTSLANGMVSQLNKPTDTYMLPKQFSTDMLLQAKSSERLMSYNGGIHAASSKMSNIEPETRRSESPSHLKLAKLAVFDEDEDVTSSVPSSELDHQENNPNHQIVFRPHWSPIEKAQIKPSNISGIYTNTRKRLYVGPSHGFNANSDGEGGVLNFDNSIACSPIAKYCNRVCFDDESVSSSGTSTLGELATYKVFASPGPQVTTSKPVGEARDLIGVSTNHTGITDVDRSKATTAWSGNTNDAAILTFNKTHDNDVLKASTEKINKIARRPVFGPFQSSVTISSTSLSQPSADIANHKSVDFGKTVSNSATSQRSSGNKIYINNRNQSRKKSIESDHNLRLGAPTSHRGKLIVATYNYITKQNKSTLSPLMSQNKSIMTTLMKQNFLNQAKPRRKSGKVLNVFEYDERGHRRNRIVIGKNPPRNTGMKIKLPSVIVQKEIEKRSMNTIAKKRQSSSGSSSFHDDIPGYRQAATCETIARLWKIVDDWRKQKNSPKPTVLSHSPMRNPHGLQRTESERSGYSPNKELKKTFSSPDAEARRGVLPSTPQIGFALGVTPRTRSPEDVLDNESSDLSEISNGIKPNTMSKLSLTLTNQPSPNGPGLGHSSSSHRNAQDTESTLIDEIGNCTIYLSTRPKDRILHLSPPRVQTGGKPKNQVKPSVTSGGDNWNLGIPYDFERVMYLNEGDPKRRTAQTQARLQENTVSDNASWNTSYNKSEMTPDLTKPKAAFPEKQISSNPDIAQYTTANVRRGRSLFRTEQVIQNRKTVSANAGLVTIDNSQYHHGLASPDHHSAHTSSNEVKKRSSVHISKQQAKGNQAKRKNTKGKNTKKSSGKNDRPVKSKAFPNNKTNKLGQTNKCSKTKIVKSPPAKNYLVKGDSPSEMALHERTERTRQKLCLKEHLMHQPVCVNSNSDTKVVEKGPVTCLSPALFVNGNAEKDRTLSSLSFGSQSYESTTLGFEGHNNKVVDYTPRKLNVQRFGATIDHRFRQLL